MIYATQEWHVEGGKKCKMYPAPWKELDSEAFGFPFFFFFFINFPSTAVDFP